MGHVKCVLDNEMSCSIALECGALGHVGYVLDNVVLCSMLCGACGLWVGQWGITEDRESSSRWHRLQGSSRLRLAPRMEYGWKSYLIQSILQMAMHRGYYGMGGNGDGSALEHLLAGKFDVFPRLWKWWGS